MLRENAQHVNLYILLQIFNAPSAQIQIAFLVLAMELPNAQDVFRDIFYKIITVLPADLTVLYVMVLIHIPAKHVFQNLLLNLLVIVLPTKIQIALLVVRMGLLNAQHVLQDIYLLSVYA